MDGDARKAVATKGQQRNKRQEGKQMSDVSDSTRLRRIRSSSVRGAEPWWPRGWWRIIDTRIGIIPVPVYVILFALLAGFTYTGTSRAKSR